MHNRSSLHKTTYSHVQRGSAQIKEANAQMGTAHSDSFRANSYPFEFSAAYFLAAITLLIIYYAAQPNTEKVRYSISETKGYWVS